MNIKNLDILLVLFIFINSYFCFAQNDIEIITDISKLCTIDTAGCNLVVDEQLSDSEYSLKLVRPTHNWFSGLFEGIDTTKEIIFSLSMNGNSVEGTVADVAKWDGLRPVYTYGKYRDYNTYIYYTKNFDGYWISSDYFLADENKFAGNGKIPIQSIIPSELAEEFLSEDGNYWSAWQEITDCYINTASNTFFMTKQFNLPNIAIAIKYPYNYDYQFEYMAKLKDSQISGVTVHNIGKSKSKEYDLFIIEVHDPKASVEELQDRRVVLIYANEDGNEPDSSWVVNGSINYLIESIKTNDKFVMDTLKEVTFLFVPMFDPDGSSESSYSKITSDFLIPNLDNVRDEVVAYIKFINQWCGKNGNRLDLVVNLHNIECNEAPNIICPFIDIENEKTVIALNSFVLKNMPNTIKTSSSIWIDPVHLLLTD